MKTENPNYLQELRNIHIIYETLVIRALSLKQFENMLLKLTENLVRAYFFLLVTITYSLLSNDK